MLVFIVPIKSARVAVSWEHVCRLLDRTTRSLCAQTSSEFRVLVICHEKPEEAFAHAQLEYVSVSHPAPSSSDPFSMRSDIARKRLAGLTRAMEYSPTHVMFVDGDDCVSNRLADFVARNSPANGWYVRSGYFYSKRQSRLHLERLRFNQWCGSSYIVRPEHLQLVKEDRVGLWIDHRKVTRKLRERGISTRPLPFRGAVYCVSHGDNFWDYESILWPSQPVLRAVRRVIFHRALTPAIRQEFGLYPVLSEATS